MHICQYGLGKENSVLTSGVSRNFVGEGGSTNSVEDRENGDLEAVAPYSGVLEAAVISYKKFHLI